MYKKFWLAVLIIMHSFAACAQTKQTNMNNRFDIETYNKNKQAGEYTFEHDGVKVRQTDFDGGYAETTSKPDTYIDHYREYYKNGTLKEEGDLFNKSVFRLGTWRFFNEQGVEQKSVNYDAPYTFTLDKVMEFLKRNNLSLADRWTSINRKSDTIGDRWIVTHEDGHIGGADIQLKHVNLDAVTGKVITIKTSTHHDN